MNRPEAEQAIRQAVQHVYLGDHTALTRILGYHKFFVDTRDVGFGGHILLDGFWESWLTLFCLRNVTRDMVAVDVGANMGYYTILFGNNVGPDGHVIAVEPNPRAVSLLRKSVDINGYTARTRIAELACSDGASPRARLAIPATEPKNAHVLDDTDVSSLSAIDIECTTLDKLCSTHERVDFIKIDAEGAEERIFAGMSGVLERHRPMVVIEINVARYADPAGFVRRLRSVYGELRFVSYDGHAEAVTEHELMSRNAGQDWLIVLSPEKPL
ncbi:MAG: FkbM family methyltransferase [Bradyrhizobium sp.]